MKRKPSLVGLSIEQLRQLRDELPTKMNEMTEAEMDLYYEIDSKLGVLQRMGEKEFAEAVALEVEKHKSTKH